MGPFPYQQSIRFFAALGCLMLLLFLLTAFQPSLFSQRTINPTTKHLTLEDGLRQSSILALFQDSHGIIWIGTEDGLHKYDGYTFTVFAHQPGDAHTLSNSSVNSIVEDGFGNLWVGTDYGLNQFDLATESVRRVFLIDSASVSRQFHRVRHLVYDGADSLLWIGTNGGLRQLKPASRGKGAMSVTPPPFIGPGINRTAILRLFLDSENDLWFGTASGIGKVEREYGKAYYPFIREQQFVFDLVEDGKGYIWCSSNRDVKAFHKDSLGMEARPVIHRDSINFEYNIPLCKDKSGHIWAATVKGLFQFNSGNGNIITTIKEYDTERRPTLPQYTTMIQDSSGVFWIGAYGGIRILNLNEQRFNHFRAPQALEGSSRFVRSVYEDDEGTTWFGTQIAGLYHLRKGELIPKRFDLGMPVPAVIEAIAGTPGGEIWVGTNVNGLLRLNKKNGAAAKVVFPQNLRDKPGTRPDLVTSILIGREGFIWIGGEGGLFWYDPRRETFLYATTPLDYPVTIRSIAQDSAGMLWIGTLESGLFQFGPGSINNPDPTLLPVPIRGEGADYGEYNRINHIFCSPTGALWLSTYGGGLVKMDVAADTFSFFNSSNTDLPDDIIYGALEDEKGFLWVSSNKGIARLDPRNRDVWAFDYRDGLQSNEFNSGVCFKTKTGKMYFGGINGLNAFWPEKIAKNECSPPVAFTDFRIDYESVPIGEQSVLKKHINCTDTLILRHWQNNLSFEVAALNYYIPEKNQYKYRLAPYDEDWVESGTRRFFSYTNLGPGTYTLEVKGSNHDGVWNTHARQMTIIIRPPWYWNAFAQFIYLLLLALAIYGFYRFQLSRRLAEREAQLAIREARRLREHDELKSRFFANVSHELRTPLSLIYGSAEMIQGNGAFRGQILHNARILQNQTQKILDLARLEASRIKLSLIQDDAVNLLRNICASFAVLANRKKIDLQYHSTEQEMLMDLDPERLQQVISNLLSNALKFTSEGGAVKMYAEKITENSGPWLKIAVQDTGVGIEEANQDKIFERYFQESNSGVQVQPGAGIGLSLAKGLVELMGGRIRVQSEKGTGAIFTVLLPATQKAERKPAELALPEIEAVSPPPVPADDKTSLADKKTTILIIDDHPGILQHFRFLLKKDYRLLFAADGQSGIDKAIRSVPDIVISDIIMPEKNGYEVCETLKDNPITNHIPIILLTAKDGPDPKQLSLEKGADAFLAKPFEKEELSARLRNLIRLQKILQEKYAKTIFIRFTEEENGLAGDPFMEAILTVIEEKYSDEHFGAPQLCQSVPYSRAQVFKKVKATTGRSVNEFINLYRLRKARPLIEDTALPISQVAYQVGFGNPDYFTKKYKKEYGEAPVETRRRRG
ncbi:MAG: response regulator [Phaeodactylibacter sp.]|nr:response regulator [Phaeodactylibacter sp.]